MSIVNHFCNKIVSALRDVHIIQIFWKVPPKKDFLEGISCLCVENVMHVSDPFFSDEVMVLEDSSHKVLVVISGQTGFALKIALKC